MHGRVSGIDELRHFFLAQDGRQRKCPFRIGSLGGAPGPLERLGVEESQRGKISRDGARSVLPIDIRECAWVPGGQENAGSVVKNLPLCGCNCVWYFVRNYVAGVLPASFFVDGS